MHESNDFYTISGGRLVRVKVRNGGYALRFPAFRGYPRWGAIQFGLYRTVETRLSSQSVSSAIWVIISLATADNAAKSLAYNRMVDEVAHVLRTHWYDAGFVRPQRQELGIDILNLLHQSGVSIFPD